MNLPLHILNTCVRTCFVGDDDENLRLSGVKVEDLKDSKLTCEFKKIYKI
jgi:hypothetical protein